MSSKGKDKNIIFVSDVAYLDYSGEKHECRKFFKKFGNMPDNVLIVVAYTSKKASPCMASVWAP